jgi:hypothetical protein
MASINMGLALARSSLLDSYADIQKLANLAATEIDGFFPLSSGKGGSQLLVSDAEALMKEIESTSDGQLLLQGKSRLRPDFSYSVVGEMVEVQLVCDIGMRKVGPKLADGFAEILTAMVQKGVSLSGICALGIRGLNLRRVRPPRFFGAIDIDSVVDIYASDMASHLADRVTTIELPTAAEKIIAGNYVIVNWHQGIDLEDQDAVRSCLEAKQLWLSKNVEAPVADGWNALGDSRFEIGSARPQEGLSLYEPAMARGFVTAHGAEDGALVARRIEDFSTMLIGGRLIGSDFALEEGAIIANDRETALKMFEQFSQSQIRWFLYADGDGLFNPFPEGNWQN